MDTAQANAPEVMIEIIKIGEAPKLSLRSDSKITYEIGRVGHDIFMRIAGNASGGKFSKEWIAVTALEACLPKDDSLMHANSLAGAFQKKSQNNQGFLTAALRAEGILKADTEKPTLNRVDMDLDKWGKQIKKLEAIRSELKELPIPSPFSKRALSSTVKHDATTLDQSTSEGVAPTASKKKKKECAQSAQQTPVPDFGERIKEGETATTAQIENLRG